VIEQRLDRAPRPTAGALNLVESRSVAPKSGSVAEYVTDLAAHCPFLTPSVERGLTGWTIYETAHADRYAVEAELFYAAVQAAEWIRPLRVRQHGGLRCENVVILDPAGIANHRELMCWPYWALRHLYGPVGIVFGKFYEGTHESDKGGRRIPPPPFSFLAVRAAVLSKDARFLRSTPELAASLTAAEDDGRDVFEHIPCEWKAVRAWASSLPARPRH
jgi:hypothetical protein